MQKLLLSSFVLLSITPLQAVKSIRKHIVATTLYALKNPEKTEVSVKGKKLVFYDEQGDLTKLSVKKVHRAIKKTIKKGNKGKRKIERFKTGTDLNKLDLDDSVKEDMVQERITVFNALYENDPEKLAPACEELQFLEANCFFDSQDPY